MTLTRLAVKRSPERLKTQRKGSTYGNEMFWPYGGHYQLKDEYMEIPGHKIKNMGKYTEIKSYYHKQTMKIFSKMYTERML